MRYKIDWAIMKWSDDTNSAMFTVSAEIKTRFSISPTHFMTKNKTVFYAKCYVVKVNVQSLTSSTYFTKIVSVA